MFEKCSRGDNTDSSDIDIIADMDSMSITDMNYIKNQFHETNVDVLLPGL